MAAAARCRSLALTLLLACSVVVAAAAADDGDAALTHLHFYFHEIEAGAPNATVANVASLHRNGSTFGDVAVFDCPLREGPDPASRLIGRGQALGVHTSLDGATASAAIVFVFSSGEYAGSTLATQGVYNTSGGPAERSIVGGTGKLRFARGYMTSSVVSSTNTSYVVVFDLYLTLAY
ncbi:hypothetical protein HU200_006693 [Digitaria exilis]|uniref:Dirigent protein n=1 Tax=Digitaria exilis TaxID=1010633 RepID=A0A835KT22_9POAL|nr:hypothetical protein HU200_006693 [Digitaria exilis]CAB3488597.1 unnamed protein product [Digitaria exilis]